MSVKSVGIRSAIICAVVGAGCQGSVLGQCISHSCPHCDTRMPRGGFQRHRHLKLTHGGPLKGYFPHGLWPFMSVTFLNPSSRRRVTQAAADAAQAGAAVMLAVLDGAI